MNRQCRPHRGLETCAASQVDPEFLDIAECPTPCGHAWDNHLGGLSAVDRILQARKSLFPHILEKEICLDGQELSRSIIRILVYGVQVLNHGYRR